MCQTISRDVIQLADDCSLVVSDDTKITLEHQMRENMITLEQYFIEKNLKMNIDKTQLIGFSYLKENSNISFTHKIHK